MPNKDQGRIPPMFISLDDARMGIQAWCVEDDDEPLSAEQCEWLITRLQPQWWLADEAKVRPAAKSRKKKGTRAAAALAAPTANSVARGQTRMGGAPDLPRGSRWPHRKALPDLAKAELRQRKATAASWVSTQLAAPVPYEFVAQIDLASLPALDSHELGLPKHGRLLFFVDDAVLMHNPSGNPDACLVVHDESPIDTLERLEVPAMFDTMNTWWRNDGAGEPKDGASIKAESDVRNAQAVAMLRKEGDHESADMLEKAIADLGPIDFSTPATKPFVHPPRAMLLVPLWVLPGSHTVELELDGQLKAFAEDESTEPHFETLTTIDGGPFLADPEKWQRQDNFTIAHRAIRLLGPPQPEQDDPRYDALSDDGLPPYPWDDAASAQALEKAKAWQLLLQVGVAALTQQEHAEGTYYFVIRKSDFRRSDFSRVRAVYQQT